MKATMGMPVNEWKVQGKTVNGRANFVGSIWTQMQMLNAM